MKLNILIVICSSLLGLFLCEVFARFFLKVDGAFHQHARYDFENYELLRPADHVIDIKRVRPDGSVLYDVKYNFDHLGRRKTPRAKEANSATLFFGGSFTFGNGLQDHESLPWLYGLSRPETQVYNYAYSGHGPHTFLSKVNTLPFDEHIPKNLQHVDVHFLSYFFHTERYLGSLRWVGRNIVNDPYYEWDGSEIIYKGNFASGRPITTFLYWVLYHSKLVRLFGTDTGNSFEKYSQKFLCGLINETQRSLKVKLKGRLRHFYFVVSPFQTEKNYGEDLATYYRGVKKCLSDQVIFMSIKPPEEFDTHVEKYVLDKVLDRHPSRHANEWLAKELP